MKNEIKGFVCIGAGFVGDPHYGCNSRQMQEPQINVVDKNSNRSKLWNSYDLNKLPIFEPGLEKLLKM